MSYDLKNSVQNGWVFFRLGWLWRVIQRRLPKGYLERKRRIDCRVARMVVRQSWLTVRQLADRKGCLSHQGRSFVLGDVKKATINLC